MRPTSRSRRLPALVLALGLAGCAAPMQPLADFGGAAHALADEWRPFLPAVQDDCEQLLRYKRLTLPGDYDVRQVHAQAASECAGLGEQARTAGLLASALEDYAHALATLAGARPNVFDAGLAGLESTAADLHTAAGTSLFDAHRLGAAERLARTAARVATARAETTLARSLLADHQDDVATVAGAMKAYADTIVLSQSQQLHEVMAGELGRLARAASAPTQADVEGRLPWRFAQEAVRRDLEANEARARRVHDFDVAADQLVAAHAALVQEFEHLSRVERLQGVDDLVTRVKALRDELGGK